ncbi:RIP metalloprotease RseP [Amylibacter sp. SFDW26]|uniref:RIP metalloprotease RseP n=1 Tax=Amylibacter sp. SFDW26 TaxID=2652722 RepID=UPI0012628A4C|nr:RIP metalloprotease RseP [Amylibacter sp. SFDW26]KAB7615881.1 RIP metalloprotease RseP [Amylibacter sp. SFDW26]
MFDFLNYIPVVGPLLTTIVPFVIVLSIVVAIHEYGHYIVGRWCGIHAEVFSLGFGPVIVSRYDKHGTKWQLAALPLGGYVRFLGDSDGSSLKTSKVDATLQHKTLNGAKLYKRALTVFAGPAANFILSAVIFTGLAFYIGTASNAPIVGKVANLPSSLSQLEEGDEILSINRIGISEFADIYNLYTQFNDEPSLEYAVIRNGKDLIIPGPSLSPALVGNVLPVSPASKAGLEQGDVILSADNIAITSFSRLVEIIKDSKSESIALNVWRNGTEIELSITPEFRDIQVGEAQFEKRMMIGVSSALPFHAVVESVPAFDAVMAGISRTYFVISSSIDSIYLIITGKVGAENLQGPLGIAQVSGHQAASGLLAFISLIGFISTAIGFLNLLPIPVLDGGHLVLYLYEAVVRRPPSPKAIQVVMTMGLTMLLSLMLFATFNDIMRL